MSLTPEQRKELRQALTTFDDHDRIDRGLAVALDDIDWMEDLLKRAMAVLEEYETHRPSCVCQTCNLRLRRRAVLKEWRSRPK